MKYNRCKLLSSGLAGFVAGVMLVFSGAGNAVDLTVYTAVEAEDLKRYAATFNSGSSRYQYKVGAGFHRDCYRQTAGGKGQPAGRCCLGAGGNFAVVDEIRGDVGAVQTQKA